MSSNFDFDPLKVSGSGHFIRITAGENLTNRQLVYLNADGNYYLADASAVATMPTLGIVIGNIAVGTSGLVLIKGYLGLSTWTWTVGATLYLSDVAGAMAEAAGTFSQEVGHAVLTTQIWFDPQGLGGESPILDYEVQTGIIAEPSTASKGNGHAVVVHNETEERDFLWIRTDLDTKWAGCEYL